MQFFQLLHYTNTTMYKWFYFDTRIIIVKLLFCQNHVRQWEQAMGSQGEPWIWPQPRLFKQNGWVTRADGADEV